MIDRDKVMNGLECCVSNDRCKECPYGHDQNGVAVGITRCTEMLAGDALSMFKEWERQLKEWEKYAPFLSAHGVLGADMIKREIEEWCEYMRKEVWGQFE